MTDQKLQSRVRHDIPDTDISSWEVQRRRIAAALADAMYELVKSKTALIGAIMLVVLAGVCLATPILATHNPIKQNYKEMRKSPSVDHYLGTDRYGRDIYSRLLYGGRRVVGISLAAVVFGLLLGVPMGIFAGYFGGWVDGFSMRFVDFLLAFPGLLLYLLIVTLAREWKLEGIFNDMILVFALGISFMPFVARLARGSSMSESKKEYVEAAHIAGEGDFRIAMREILPNCMSPLVIQATVNLGFAILIIAALSFLGLGTPPPTPDWGADLSAARDHMETHPMIAIYPGLAICYAVLAFNLFGDGLRDILDPRISER